MGLIDDWADRMEAAQRPGDWIPVRRFLFFGVVCYLLFIAVATAYFTLLFMEAMT